jgi:hypothetical protein
LARGRHSAKLVVNQGEQLVRGLFVAAIDGVENFGHVGHTPD